jgi:hypothetical protein
MGSLCCAMTSHSEPSLPSDPVQMTLRRKVENYLLHEKKFSELDLGIFRFEPLDYEVLEKLSKPSSLPVSVFRVKHKISEEIFALKTIDIYGKSEEEIKLVINTIKAFSLASNSHLAEFYGFHSDGATFYVLEEFLDSNLKKLLESHNDLASRVLNEDNITRLFLSLLECCNFLTAAFERSRDFILCPKHIYYKDDFSSIKISGLAATMVKNHFYASPIVALRAARSQDKM